MKLEIIDFEQFYKLISILYEIGVKVSLCYNKDRDQFSMIMLDTIRTLFVRIAFKQCEKFKFAINDSLTLSFEIRDFYKVSKAFTKFDQVDIIFNQNENTIEFVGKKKNTKGCMKSQLKLIAEQNTEELVDLSGFDAEEMRSLGEIIEYSMQNDCLVEAIKAASNFESIITFNGCQDGLKIENQGTVGGMEYYIEKEELGVRYIKDKKEELFPEGFEARATFTLKKLDTIVDQTRDKVVFRFGEGLPISFKYEYDIADCYYTLAPRVVEE